MDDELVSYLKQHFELPAVVTANDAATSLAAKINQLIVEDFESLIRLLYIIDVDERKLKKMLKENTGNDAGDLIASMIIERQTQKIRSRRESRDQNNIIDEDDRW